jgi:hypothetical protein
MWLLEMFKLLMWLNEFLLDDTVLELDGAVLTSSH